MLLLLAGQVGPWAPLEDMRREVHEAVRAERAEEIAARKARNNPLDDTSDWGALAFTAKVLTETIVEHDTAKVRRLAGELLAGTAAALAPLPPYASDVDTVGVRVRFRVLSEARRRVLAGELDVAIERAQAHGGDVLKFIEADEEGLAAIAAYVTETLVGIEGVNVLDDQGDERLLEVPLQPVGVDALRRAGLLTPIFVVARAFQGMPAKKALRFGQPQPSTSPSDSTARDAQSADESSGGALVAQARIISKEPDTRPIAVLGGTSRTTATTSAAPSPSAAPSASTSDSRASIA